MKKIVKKIAITLSVICLVTSCKKDSSTSNSTSTGIGAGTFTWTETNNSTVQTADSAYASTNYKTIFAYKGGTQYFFEINLSSLAVGTYSLTTSANVLTYKRPADANYLVATAGGIEITANANNKLTGSGVGTITATERVNVTFTNMPIQ